MNTSRPMVRNIDDDSVAGTPWARRESRSAKLRQVGDDE
jgi:hypothetical protein